MAAKVIVWLGPTARGSETTAMAALTELQRHVSGEIRESRRKGIWMGWVLCSRRIIQEVILANRVGLRAFCAGQIVRWETLEGSSDIV
jgi:hypothetical protein